MLSKRVNDIIFIGIIVVVAVSIIFMRFVLINQIDENITQLRARNETLIQEINVIRGNVDRYRDTAAPTLVELHHSVPRQFDRNQLSLFITSEAFRAGITNEQEFGRTISVNTTPATPLEGSPHRELSNHFNLHIVNLRYTATSLDELYAFLDLLEESNQLFLIHSISYQTANPTTGRIPIDITFYAVYYKSSGSS